MPIIARSRWVVLALAATALPALAADVFLAAKERKSLPAVETLSPWAAQLLLEGNVSGTEPRLGVPTFFWAARTPVSGWRSAGLTPVEAARRHVVAHAELYRGSPARWAEAEVRGVHALPSGGPIIVSFGQRVAGAPVFRDTLRVLMTQEYELVALSGYLTPETRVQGERALTDEALVGSAFTSLTGRGFEVTDVARIPSPHSDERRFSLSRQTTPVRVKDVQFATPSGLIPSVYVEMEVDGVDYRSFVVSAVDGTVLFDHSLTAADAFGYRVWANEDFVPKDGPQGNEPTPHPTGTTSAAQPPFVPQSLITLEHAGLSTRDPWLAPGSTQTRGNNTVAYIDSARGDGFGMGDFMPTVTTPGVFDRVYDPTQNPDVSETQRMAAATQLFYDVNFFHDWFYDSGFDEASGNGQTNNFGRGGRQGDPVLSEGQDFSGRNNANMSTPSDGASPRMQMYIFTSAGSGRVTVGGMNVPAGGAQFGPTRFNVMGTLAVVNDGSAAPTLGCAANWPMGQVTGKIALVERGTCPFTDKVINAQAAGAVAVMLYDNVAGQQPPPLSGTAMTMIRIPTVSLTQAQGRALAMQAAAGTVSATLERTAGTDRDGTLDNAIIAHEWGHYISNRLVGNGSGLSNRQGGGMGEGWGDFHALLMMARAEDAQLPVNQQWKGVFTVGGYTTSASNPNGHYFGVRRLPYSVDFTKNALTFKHIAQGEPLPTGPATSYGQDGRGNAEVHSTGEVWASALWECYVALLTDGRYTFAQAQTQMKRYLVAGYKLTPDQPTMLEARDAIVAAASAAVPADAVLLSRAFARRGMGMLAVAPPRDSEDNRPVVESFEVGNGARVVKVTLDDSVNSCDRDGTLDANEEGLLTVTVKNTGLGALTQLTANITSDSTLLTFPMGTQLTFSRIEPTATGRATLPVRLSAVQGILAAVVTVRLTDSTFVPSLQTTPPSGVGQFRLNVNSVPASTATDDVESPMSTWQTGNDPRGNTGSDWRIFQASATQHYWFGPNPASPADTYLVSPALNVGMAPFVVSFKHRFAFEADAMTFYDGAVVEFSTDDGRTWTDAGGMMAVGYNGSIPAQSSNPLKGRAAFVGKSMGYPAFVPVRIDAGTRFAGQTVKMRFRIGSDDAAADKGWEVDDISFTGSSNTPFGSLANDPNMCSNRPPVIQTAGLVEVDEGAMVALTAMVSDPDGDMVTVSWVQRSGPMVMLQDGRFTAPSVTSETTLRFEVSASDGRATAGPVPVEVRVRDTNRAPVIEVPATVSLTVGQAGEVVATATDPDGDALTYRWAQTGGQPLTLGDLTGNRLEMTASAAGESSLVLTVSDGVLSTTANVQVVATVAGGPQTPGGGGPKGCGCTSVEGGAMGLLLSVLASRRRRSSRLQ
jgi:large repetitive protein